MSIGDLSGRMKRVKFGTGPNGYAGAEFAIDCDLTEAFFLASYLPGRRLTLGGGGGTAWDGRIEDVTIDGNGITARALGYWAALYDVPYTGLWVSTATDDFTDFPAGYIGTGDHTRQGFETNTTGGSIYITAKKATILSSASPGRLFYRVPHLSASKISGVSFGYNVAVSSGSWLAGLELWNESGAGLTYAGSTPWSRSTTGTGTQTLQFSSAVDAVSFTLTHYTGTLTTTAETGTDFLTVTNFRAWSGASTSLYSDRIAAGMAAYVAGINSGQLSSGSTLIQSPGVSLTQEVYEDEWPGDVLKRLVEYGDNLNPPRRWEVGVYDSQQLYFRPRGSAGRAWYVDAANVRVDFTISALRNSAYGVYRGSDGRTMRTAASTDSASVSAFNNITRRAAVKLDSTSSTQATTARDAALQDGKTPTPRAEIAFSELYDGAGARYPLYTVRSGDTITIRNLPANVSTVIDRLRTFLVIETEYDADSDTIRVVPEDYLPALVVTGRTRAQDRGRG